MGVRSSPSGQGVALDGIPVLDLRKRMAALLEGCGVPSRLEGMSVTTTYYLPQPAQQVGRQAGSEERRRRGADGALPACLLPGWLAGSGRGPVMRARTHCCVRRCLPSMRPSDHCQVRWTREGAGRQQEAGNG